MAVATNSFDGSGTTSGTTVSAGNSGGGGDTAFTTITGTPTFDNTHAAHGTLAVKYVTAASTAQVRWDSIGSAGQLWVRIYGYLTANPSVSTRLGAISASTGGLCSNLNMNTSGNVIMTNSAGTATLTTVGTIPLNAWWRVEAFVICSATVGQIELKPFFSTPDATSPSETTLTSAANLNTLASGTGADRFGVGPLNSTTITYWCDDLGYSTTAYLGPATTNASPNAGLAAATGVPDSLDGKISVGPATGAATGAALAATTTSPINAGLAAATGVPPVLNDSVALHMTIQGV